MRTPLLIVLTAFLLGAVIGLAIMNNACKSGRYEWCAPIADFRHHAKTAHG